MEVGARLVPGLGDEYITVWNASAISSLSREQKEFFRHVVDAMGVRSQIAQGLGAPITDLARITVTDQRLYLAAECTEGGKVKVLGLLKTGSKRLFIRTITGALREEDPPCVLDFYVHESCQRMGIGNHLFAFMLQAEGLSPERFAYDRPSPKLMSFVAKHYGLRDHVPQTNSFVVFDAYWDAAPQGGRGKAEDPRWATVQMRPLTANNRAAPPPPVGGGYTASAAAPWHPAPEPHVAHGRRAGGGAPPATWSADREAGRMAQLQLPRDEAPASREAVAGYGRRGPSSRGESLRERAGGEDPRHPAHGYGAPGRDPYTQPASGAAAARQERAHRAANPGYSQSHAAAPPHDQRGGASRHDYGHQQPDYGHQQPSHQQDYGHQQPSRGYSYSYGAHPSHQGFDYSGARGVAGGGVVARGEEAEVVQIPGLPGASARVGSGHAGGGRLGSGRRGAAASAGGAYPEQHAQHGYRDNDRHQPGGGYAQPQGGATAQAGRAYAGAHPSTGVGVGYSSSQYDARGGPAPRGGYQVPATKNYYERVAGGFERGAGGGMGDLRGVHLGGAGHSNRVRNMSGGGAKEALAW